MNETKRAIETLRAAMRDAHTYRLTFWAYPSEALKASDVDHAALATLTKVAEENERLRKILQDPDCQDVLNLREQWDDAVVRAGRLAAENTALKAEVERMKGIISLSGDAIAISRTLDELYEAQILVEKAEAGVKEWRGRCVQVEVHAADLKAELDAARPLIEAADKVIISKYQDVHGASAVLIPYISEGEDDLRFAVIAYRASKEKEGRE